MTSQQETTELAELLNGLVPTEYSPYFTLDSVEGSLELVREMRHGGNLPEAVNGLHYRAWTRIYQAPEGYVVVWSGKGPIPGHEDRLGNLGSSLNASASLSRRVTGKRHGHTR